MHHNFHYQCHFSLFCLGLWWRCLIWDPISEMAFGRECREGRVRLEGELGAFAVLISWMSQVFLLFTPFPAGSQGDGDLVTIWGSFPCPLIIRAV